MNEIPNDYQVETSFRVDPVDDWNIKILDVLEKLKKVEGKSHNYSPRRSRMRLVLVDEV